jgi:CHAT domain-containing protein
MVSSYIPSILALVRANGALRSMPRREVRGLLVHEGSPGRGWAPITKVQDESRRVKECFEAAESPITVLNETSAHPTVPEVLRCLSSDIHVLHLACHGAQRRDPLASAFILRDADLSIQEIMKLDLKHASLAFLSACQTAKGDQNQPDQAVHLAASLLFCGFKSVIATMWLVPFHCLGAS